jgi:Arc/MetJ-type ribon-helix-helix transcriptional regulator
MPPFTIFLSSTKEDLKSYREAVRKKLDEIKEELDIDVVGMEDFGARPEPPIQTCLDEVSRSDMYIGIIGMRYGSIDDVTKKSIVELEYEKAAEKELPALMYLIDENEGRIPPNSVQCDKIRELNEFKDHIKKDHNVAYFTTEENLASRVERDVRSILQKKGIPPKENREGSVLSKSPFIAGTLTSSILVKGDVLIISGIATNAPVKGIGVWIFGEKFFNYSTAQVFPDESFEFLLSPRISKKMETGQYFVVLQHPMENGELDVFPIMDGIRKIVKNTKNRDFFVVEGMTRITGSEAAQNLVTIINTSHVDDTYTKLSFLVEDPVITIDPIENVTVGQSILVKGCTNISSEHDLLFEVTAVTVKKSEIKNVFGVAGFGAVASISKGRDFNTWEATIVRPVFQAGRHYVYVYSDALDVWQISEFDVKEN